MVDLWHGRIIRVVMFQEVSQHEGLDPGQLPALEMHEVLGVSHPSGLVLLPQRQFDSYRPFILTCPIEETPRCGQNQGVLRPPQPTALIGGCVSVEHV